MASSVPAPAFFTVLVGGFSEKMKIPRAFVNHFNGPALCQLEGPNGNCWDVKLEEKNNDFFFHKGWKKFVKDNFLDEGDFLVFNYDGNSCFKVTIYDESACEMDIEAAKTKRSGGAQRRDDVPPGESRIIEFKSKHFCFKRTMERHRLYQLVIPITIARAKLDMGRQILELRDPKNRPWPVTVAPMEDGRLLVNKGWRDCCKANQVKVGHTIVLEFVKKHGKLHIFRDEGCDVILSGPHVVD
ncbi:PREDICTED: B3 domain-containing protein REM5-like [Fragaria vesca subsp. vesca]|uniref:B3 domain-containing protein REM5-like n=1 Tax=Fragaria vesca subsp. vesca TaxID=101020 RepID=UPI0002C2FB1F|nr:PREDICTED: B3 domain-containing protein REM5-like [Fragaria vesca subsp. vesca]XP_011466851.1 PREDICTED: B3 domain-containing protein REM5-like [Fragaria vesca subsp. vesca]XP_011466852.1 PREDICTED: B3 domain-containing protein REM5-like [Fragaria vesca subsp. vesca]XP_011466853.1 PREDICTED: B3 domain-containing protein REM5-like [Fragaria vesca subsp. vesca]XP_011466854.1 PREDICTED: B3 domain-containing protein REM5-like [Fragaria vesca subsp. vesca]XP_011466855.1 PREDICTED: B3 domain-cont